MKETRKRMGIKSFGCTLLGPVSWAFSGCREAYKEDVEWEQWLIGIGEMIGGGALAIFGTIELGEAIVLQGGSTFGLGLGTIMLGGGAFLLVDGNFRSSISNYTWNDTANLATGAAEMTAGAALIPMGINSLYETYNGQNFSYFELGLGLVGVGGGGYLAWDGYKKARCAINKETCVSDKVKEEIKGAIIGDKSPLEGVMSGFIGQGAKRKQKEHQDAVKQGVEDFEGRLSKGIGNIFLRKEPDSTGDEKSMSQVAGKKKPHNRK